MSDLVPRIRNILLSCSPCEQAESSIVANGWLPETRETETGGRVTERMTLTDKRKGERGKESDEIE